MCGRIPCCLAIALPTELHSNTTQSWSQFLEADCCFRCSKRISADSREIGAGWVIRGPCVLRESRILRGKAWWRKISGSVLLGVGGGHFTVPAPWTPRALHLKRFLVRLGAQALAPSILAFRATARWVAKGTVPQERIARPTRQVRGQDRDQDKEAPQLLEVQGARCARRAWTTTLLIRPPLRIRGVFTKQWVQTYQTGYLKVVGIS